MGSRQGLAASGLNFSPDIWQDDGTRMSDSCVTGGRCGLNSVNSEGWAYSELIGQNSFWLRRPATIGRQDGVRPSRTDWCASVPANLLDIRAYLMGLEPVTRI